MRRPLYKESYYNNKQQEGNSFNWVDAGVAIGMLTALGYVVAYSYQKGFLSYFGVEEVFISEMALPNIIFSIAAVGLSLFFLYGTYNYLELIMKEFPVSSKAVWLMLRKATIPTFFVTVFWLGFIEYWELYLFLLSIIGFYYFVYPIILYSRVKGYNNKLEKRYKNLEETGINKKNILLSWKNVPSFKIFSVVTIFIGCYFIANIFGLSQAKNKDEFLIYKNNDRETFVVIDGIGDRFITAPIDLNKKEILKEYQIIDQKSSLKNPLIFEKVKIDEGVEVKN